MSPEIESVLLIRHAKSTANVDPEVYRTTPDHIIPLADPRHDPEALEAARVLASLGLDPTVLCSWVSTYLRTHQTESLVMAAALGAQRVKVPKRESFLLREQEFGDWDGLTESEMAAADPLRYARRQRLTDASGRFYFRYPNGESRADVVQRITMFIGKIHRSRYRQHVIFLHGVTQRAFRMAWFNRGVDWFEDEPNPRNASMLLIHRDDRGRWAERWIYRP